jgi:hypothetical protein
MSAKGMLGARPAAALPAMVALLSGKSMHLAGAAVKRGKRCHGPSG